MAELVGKKHIDRHIPYYVYRGKSTLRIQGKIDKTRNENMNTYIYIHIYIYMYIYISIYSVCKRPSELMNPNLSLVSLASVSGLIQQRSPT